MSKLNKYIKILADFGLKIAKLIDLALRKTLLLFIRITRPFLGPAHCRYPITCTEYAKEILETRYFLPAIFLITKRVLCCNPFCKPKLD